MTASRSPFSLRTVLYLDAGTCVAMGALLALASGPVGAFTALPPALLLYAGLSLFPIAAFMVLVARANPVSATGTWLVILGNLGWVAASLLLLVSGWVAPNALGIAFVAAQAIAVAVLAWLEHAALRGGAAVQTA